MSESHLTEITSATNARVKRACRLHAHRGRSETGLALVEGRRLTEATIASGIQIVDLFVTDPDDELAEAAERAACVPEHVLQKIATTQNPQDVVAVAEWAPLRRLPYDSRRILVLDEMSDPGNSGTLIRTAVAFGCDAIVLTQGSCDPTNPKVLRASGGAIFLADVVVGVHTDDLIKLLSERKVPVLAASAHIAGAPEDVGDSWALFIGNEAHGLSDAVLRGADRVVSVPMRGDVESLNAAASGAVLLYILATSA